MNELAETIITEFKHASNSNNAIMMKAYMKNNFEFYGINSPNRKKIQKPFLIKKYLPEKKELYQITKQLWQQPQRELHYFAQEFTFLYTNNIEENDIELYEWMIINKSWWDTVDFISVKLIGKYFEAFPNNRAIIIDRWISSDNIWLQRSAILFQLKYKQNTNTEDLAFIINSLNGGNEFFINKAIGWILREYGKVNPEWVIQFCSSNKLSKLSEREALRIIIRN